MAALFLISNHNPTSLTLSLPLPIHHHHHRPISSSFRPISPPARFPILSDDPRLRNRARGLSVVTRAGPTTNGLLLAFFLPLTLVIATVFSAIRIGDKLDEKFLEEVMLNEALRKAMEEGSDDVDNGNENDDDDDYDDDDEVDSFELPLEPPVTQRTRVNRPVREI